MKITIKHYYDFRAINHQKKFDLDNAKAWDFLRLETIKNNNAFAIAESSDRLEQESLSNSSLNRQADTIIDLVKERHFTRINSYGVGAGQLEFLLKRKSPNIFLQCSDYAPRSMERLREVFKEAEEVIVFDMLKDSWVNDGEKCLYLFYRIDTAFNDYQWRMIFKKIMNARIEHILFVPCEFLTLKRFITQEIKYVLGKSLNRKISFAGYLRTKQQIKSLFSSCYDIEDTEGIGELKGFLLKLKKGD